MLKSITNFVLLFVLTLPCSSQESNNQHRSYIEGGLVGGYYSNRGSISGVYGGAGIFFRSFGKTAALDFRGKEVYISSPEREAGAITVTYRLFLTKGFFVGGGFAHNHEVEIHNYIDDIVGSTLGNSKKIIHRTGGALETGYNFKSLVKRGRLGLYPMLGASIAFMVHDSEPNPFFGFTAGLRLGFKKTDVSGSN